MDKWDIFYKVCVAINFCIVIWKLHKIDEKLDKK